MAYREGQCIDTYRLVRRLGVGSFGEVFLAEQTGRKTQVAVKILPELTDEDLPAFLNEARAMRLRHPHIVPILDFGVDMRTHTPFIVMEYIPNGTLRQRYAKGTQLPLEAIVLYTKQIASALQYIHDERHIHRDVKPENILLRSDDEVVLSDFGIATIASSSRYQSAREVAGTITYMAPEQIQGKPVLASDQYTLGIIVYEWLSGTRPFNGTPMEIATQHMLTPPSSLREKLPSLAPEIEQVVMVALEKEPAKRFATVLAFANALEQATQRKEDVSAVESQPTPPLPPDKKLTEEKLIRDKLPQKSPSALLLPDPLAKQQISHIAPVEPLADRQSIVAPLPPPAQQNNPAPINLQPAQTATPPVAQPHPAAPSKQTSQSGIQPSRNTRAAQSRPATPPKQTKSPSPTQRLAHFFPGRLSLPAPKQTKSPPPTQSNPRQYPVAQRKRKQNWLPPLLVAIAVLLIAGIILFVLPSADVTVTLAAQSYSWPVVVSASTSQNLAQHTVPLYTTNFTTSVTQSGKASGANTSVGTAKATGVVEFTNNGTQEVLIPSGTIVSTANNILFVTDAEVALPAGSTIPVPMQAQAPGTSGNVAANTITVIPASSLSQIEQITENQGVTVKLSVTNPNPTSGGGTATATTVTQKDVSDLQAQASMQLYRELQAWLVQQQTRGNVPAKQVQESQLPNNEAVNASPAAGQVTSNGTFSETVSLSLPVQFVHASDLQAQALAQYQQLSSAKTLPPDTTKPPQGYEPVAGQPVGLQPKDCSSSSESSTANASTLCFTASAPVALPITAQQVQNLVMGRNVEVVRTQLANSKTGLPGIKAVKISVFPGFWPWMPFWMQRITVHFTVDTSL
jgi:serine/threonine protein kinase